MVRVLKSGLIVTLTLALSVIYGCHSFSDTEIERRKKASVADKKNQDIIIALVKTSANPSLFVEGAKLAIDELNGDIDRQNKAIIQVYDENGKIKKRINTQWLNKNGGGILTNRKIIPLIYDDEGQFFKGLKIAKIISRKLDVIAVVGHRFSNVAVPVSIIYEKNGIVFISTGSTHPNLTAHETLYVFRNVPSDEKIGKALAIFASKQGFQNIIIFFERSIYGKRLAEFFKEEAEKRQIKIIATRSYFNLRHNDIKRERDFRPLLAEIKKMDFEAIFLAGYVMQATTLIKQARSMGIFVPFIGGDALDNPSLWEDAKIDAVGTFVASLFDPDFSKISKQFVKRFQEKYDKFPDNKAAQGYDAVKILAWAIENSRSTIPIEIAMALKYIKKWNSVIGPYAFTLKGDISRKQVHIKVLSAGGEFKKITSIEVEKTETNSCCK